MRSSSSLASIHVVIPARFGSTRLPGKPLIDLAGAPMIVRVYGSVRAALPETVDIVVATDDERIVDSLEAYRIPVRMTDPEHQSGTDRCAQVARESGWNPDDLVVNVQGDEPLVPQPLLASFVQFCANAQTLDMATVAVPLTQVSHLTDPNVVKLVVGAHGQAIVFSRSAIPFCRDLPQGEWPLTAYLRHIGIYAYRCSALYRLTETPSCELEELEKLEQMRAIWLGMPIRVFEWPEAPPPGVDTNEDVARVREILFVNASGRS
ncbi:3-deoxy-manno-octulosonate cytidylyltransferase (CMP-KDO synthetase) [Paraburkholderia sp. BL27I4N3]|uniref:3-deoxy-manno-octulosonate cytidylyltransferase n=1 Tax=Paraburkholderia sp. BL27I4N3 TaxID=1938805 RepID=UPI000E23B21A|nr:3-deoxy-manno-octulosonate cytidylyltransferase [Paraburkholderia sp. BL27I4N3]REE23698.1 3-deoxy-manno-octulosonate cytidylyltransferase (CMP-KDO synthetase) [Paraburkholderia sp. BL27I4N3]